VFDFNKSDFFLLLVSFFIAILLWFYANLAQNPEVIRYVEVPLRYVNIPHNFQVSYHKETVKVYIGGKRLYLIKALRSKLRLYDVYVDLSGIKEGENKLKIQVKELIPYGFKVIKTDPDYIHFTAQKYVKKEKMVNIIISGQPAPGYYLKKYDVSPPIVKVSGIRAVVNNVSQVSSGKKIDIKDYKKDKFFLLALNAYNSEGEIIKDVKISPPTVAVKIVIKKYSRKKIRIKLVHLGKIKYGYVLKKIAITPEAVFIEGPEDSIKNIEEFSIRVDLTDLTKNKVINQKLVIPPSENFYFSGLKKEIEVKIKLEIAPRIVDKKFSNIALRTLLNQNDKYLYKISVPEKVDLRIKGSQLLMEQVFSGEVIPYVDVKGVNPGDKTLPINALLPKGIKLVRIYPKYAHVIIVRKVLPKKNKEKSPTKILTSEAVIKGGK
jgi:YbbR domain-containing protein